MIKRVLFATLIILSPAAAERQVTDWPQYLGPDRTGVYSGPALADAWSASGPPVLWRKAVGAGFSGPVVTGGSNSHVILFHRIAGREVVNYW